MKFRRISIGNILRFWLLMTFLLCGITARESSTLVPNQFDVSHSITQDIFDCETCSFVQDSDSPIENSPKPKVIIIESSLFRTDDRCVFPRTVNNQRCFYQNYCLTEKDNVSMKSLLRLMD